jgi:predicted ATP-grasp superfamily ATP-dependent carboligase
VRRSSPPGRSSGPGFPTSPSSVSLVGDGARARAIAVNEQLLRGGAATRAFGFCGAITPFHHPLTAEMIRIAEGAAAASGCVGSIGVDFITGEDRTWVIEINPRFQATLDTVEMATGCNLFDLHIAACRGMLPASIPAAGRCAVRRILFADRDLTVQDDLKGLAPSVADIPWPGAEIEEGGAVVSVYGCGPNRSDAMALLDKTITRVRRYMSRW